MTKFCSKLSSCKSATKPKRVCQCVMKDNQLDVHLLPVIKGKQVKLCARFDKVNSSSLTHIYSSFICRSSAKYYPDLTQSSQSTLRKSAKGVKMRPPAVLPVDDTTTVVFSFCDEQFPYRTKIPGTQVTLRKFKEYLPKKGNYR